MTWTAKPDGKGGIDLCRLYDAMGVSYHPISVADAERLVEDLQKAIARARPLDCMGGKR